MGKRYLLLLVAILVLASCKPSQTALAQELDIEPAPVPVPIEFSDLERDQDYGGMDFDATQKVCIVPVVFTPVDSPRKVPGGPYFNTVRIPVHHMLDDAFGRFSSEIYTNDMDNEKIQQHKDFNTCYSGMLKFDRKDNGWLSKDYDFQSMTVLGEEEKVEPTTLYQVTPMPYSMHKEAMKDIMVEIKATDSEYNPPVAVLQARLPPQGACFDVSEFSDDESIMKLEFLVDISALESSGFRFIQETEDRFDIVDKKYIRNFVLFDNSHPDYPTDAIDFMDFGTMWESMLDVPKILSTDRNLGFNHPGKVMVIPLVPDHGSGTIIIQPCSPLMVTEKATGLAYPMFRTKSTKEPVRIDVNRALSTPEFTVKQDELLYLCQPSLDAKDVKYRSELLTGYPPQLATSTNLIRGMMEAVRINSWTFTPLPVDQFDSHPSLFYTYEAEGKTSSSVEYMIGDRRIKRNVDYSLNGIFPTFISVPASAFVVVEGSVIEVKPEPKAYTIQPISPEDSRMLLLDQLKSIWDNPQRLSYVRSDGSKSSATPMPTSEANTHPDADPSTDESKTPKQGNYCFSPIGGNAGNCVFEGAKEVCTEGKCCGDITMDDLDTPQKEGQCVCRCGSNEGYIDAGFKCLCQ